MQHIDLAVVRLESILKKLKTASFNDDKEAANKLIYAAKHAVMAASSEAYTQQVLGEK